MMPHYAKASRRRGSGSGKRTTDADTMQKVAVSTIAGLDPKHDSRCGRATKSVIVKRCFAWTIRFGG